MCREFSQEKWKEIVSTAIKNGYPIYGVQSWIRDNPSKGVLIRHDVDRRPHNALHMAKNEAELGVRTTYYFRVTKGSFDKDIIREIHELGHEIGYHYEDLSFANGNIDKASELFKRHLDQFKEICEVKTIAMHGRPFSPHNSIHMWNTLSLDSYGIEGEALRSIDYSDSFYFTDTGRSWSENSVNLRDRVKALNPPEIASSDQIIEFINQGPAKISLSAHPERWDDGLAPWLIQYSKDKFINLAKRAISMLRKSR